MPLEEDGPLISSEHYFIGCMIKDYAFTNNLCSTAGFKVNYLESPTAKALMQCADKLYSRGACVDMASLIEKIETDSKHIDVTGSPVVMAMLVFVITTVITFTLHLAVCVSKHYSLISLRRLELVVATMLGLLPLIYLIVISVPN